MDGCICLVGLEEQLHDKTIDGRGNKAKYLEILELRQQVNVVVQVASEVASTFRPRPEENRDALDYVLYQFTCFAFLMKLGDVHKSTRLNE